MRLQGLTSQKVVLHVRGNHCHEHLRSHNVSVAQSLNYMCVSARACVRTPEGNEYWSFLFLLLLCPHLLQTCVWNFTIYAVSPNDKLWKIKE
jgi:hypothetical protein